MSWQPVYYDILDKILPFYMGEKYFTKFKQDDLIKAIKVGFDISTIPIEVIDHNTIITDLAHYAILWCKYKVVEGLCAGFEGYPSVRIPSDTIFDMVAKSGDENSFKIVCGDEYKNIMKHQKYKFFEKACIHKNKKLAIFFIEQGASITECVPGSSLLNRAFEGNIYQVIDFLKAVLAAQERITGSKNHYIIAAKSYLRDCSVLAEYEVKERKFLIKFLLSNPSVKAELDYSLYPSYLIDLINI